MDFLRFASRGFFHKPSNPRAPTAISPPLDAAASTYYMPIVLSYAAKMNRSGSAADPAQIQVQLYFTVAGPPLPDGGDSDITRGTRLTWINSQAALDGDPTYPYGPMSVRAERNTVETKFTSVVVGISGR